jgi:hypothetical protein
MKKRGIDKIAIEEHKINTKDLIIPDQYKIDENIFFQNVYIYIKPVRHKCPLSLYF